MRGRNYSQRVLVVAMLGLLMLSGGAEAAGKPKRNWEIETPANPSWAWRWRSEWTVKLSPYQADVMQDLIEYAISPWYPAYNARDMSEWIPRIENLIVEEKLNPYQAFSFLWWYQHGTRLGEPKMSSQMHRALVQLRDENLSAEWAMLAGVKCEQHAEYERWKDPPDFAVLAKEFFRRAQELDPDWDLPYYHQLAMLEINRKTGLRYIASHNDPYSEARSRIKPSPGAIKYEAQRLMRDYMGATDLSRMLPPPWAVRDSASPPVRMGGILSAPNRIRDDAPAYVGDLLNLLIEMSVDERNADDLALVLDFYAASFVHEEGHLTRFLIDDAKALPRVLQHRVLDVEVM